MKLTAIFLSFLPTLGAAANPSLMPLPSGITWNAGELSIGNGFAVSVTGKCDGRVSRAAARLPGLVSRKTGIPMIPHSPVLTAECSAAGSPVQMLEEDESYILEVSSSGARITAPNSLGALRGFATFFQLVHQGSSGFAVPAVSIRDQPRFRWRGLHLDVSRHWMPIEVVERNLDAMWAVKLNVFHWHLSDNQGFRIESKRFPKLQELGSDGLYYTQDQVREVLAYARDRGIRVLPEFDVPGHSTSLLAGYPELAAGPGPFEIGRTWGVFDPVMDPTKESVYEFLDAFIGEMAALFPDAYFHIGGDEVNGRAWSANDRVISFEREQGYLKAAHPTKQQQTVANEKLQAYFNRRVQPLVAKHGKKMMGWDEILAPDLPRNIVIHSWRGQKSLGEAVQQGLQGLLSSGYYLDHMDSAGKHYAVDPEIDPKTGAQMDLSAAERGRILGGEVCMWSEYVSAENVDSRIWPRSAAIAERFWSPASLRDPNDMYARLDVVSRNLDAFGVTHRSSYLVMLERLAGAGPVEPLRVLADVVTPLGLGGRARAMKYTQQTPLNRLVDAARPESEAARRFSQLIDTKNYDELRIWLTRWKQNPKALEPVIAASPMLREVEPLSRDLATLGQIGLQAIEYSSAGNPAPAGWAEARKRELAAMRKPRAEVTLAVVDAVEKLL